MVITKVKRESFTSVQHVVSPATRDCTGLGSSEDSSGLEPDRLQMPQMCFRCSLHFRTHSYLQQGRRCVVNHNTELVALTSYKAVPKMQGTVRASSVTVTQVKQGNGEERGWPRSWWSSLCFQLSCSFGVGEGSQVET